MAMAALLAYTAAAQNVLAGGDQPQRQLKGLAELVEGRQLWPEKKPMEKKPRAIGICRFKPESDEGEGEDEDEERR